MDGSKPRKISELSNSKSEWHRVKLWRGQYSEPPSNRYIYYEYHTTKDQGIRQYKVIRTEDTTKSKGSGEVTVILVGQVCIMEWEKKKKVLVFTNYNGMRKMEWWNNR